MSRSATFQTRARTIDHLGRGQIADCPTAVSELWKNAYDAYAQNVELHIFDGNPKVASVTDDGFGMTREDFLNRWLVIGTESKIQKDAVPEDHFGFDERPRQGEKGIGRLSAAFLAPINIIVSKKSGCPFVVAVVDWRLFENPFLALQDIRLPVEEADSSQDILPLLPSMLATVHENLTGGYGPPDRTARLNEGWKLFSDYEKGQGLNVSTVERIRSFQSTEPISSRHLGEWLVYLGLKDHGTALYMPDVHRELGVWVDPTINAQDDEVRLLKDRLKETLDAFIDPYVEHPLDFAYEVFAHGSTTKRRIISSAESFGLEDLRGLEHVVEGNFDDDGTFNGTVRVLGVDRGAFNWAPVRKPPSGVSDKIGPFSFCIGTFEQELVATTHTPEQHAILLKRAEEASGLAVYRDGLRVMPYGRPDADFFNLEERRGMNAGREFWAHRRCFGRVAFTRSQNGNLKDKAGREGLIDNRARREMRLLVIDFLRWNARRFFGSDSAIRQDELPLIKARNVAARDSASRALKRRKKNFRKALELAAANIAPALEDARSILHEMSAAGWRNDAVAATIISERLQSLANRRTDFELPPLPPKLGEDEADYRKVRDALKEFNATLEAANNNLAQVADLLATANPIEIARKRFQSNQARLSDRVTKHLRTLDATLDELKRKWASQADEDRSLYSRAAGPLIDDLEKGSRLGSVLNLLDAQRQELDEQFAGRYEPFQRSLESLMDDIDLDSALTVTEDERTRLTQQVEKIQALAQLGIAVEIIGHELETLDEQTRRNLQRLPTEIRQSEAFKLAYEAHRALTDQLRFLDPMNLAGYRARRKITGEEIANYVGAFFKRTMDASRVELVVTPAFRSLAISDLPSRIFPVFINLVNNALYWLSFSSERIVKLDRVENTVIVADSGHGVDPDDVENLFELFFTRRSQGRGVGLYLSRVNLAVANHKIRYAGENDPKILPGANFLIEFRGIQHD